MKGERVVSRGARLTWFNETDGACGRSLAGETA